MNTTLSKIYQSEKKVEVTLLNTTVSSGGRAFWDRGENGCHNKNVVYTAVPVDQVCLVIWCVFFHQPSHS